MAGTYRSRPRVSLSQIEVEALLRAASELLSGETDEYFTVDSPARAARLVAALERAEVKLGQSLVQAQKRDRANSAPR